MFSWHCSFTRGTWLTPLTCNCYAIVWLCCYLETIDLYFLDIKNYLFKKGIYGNENQCGLTFYEYLLIVIEFVWKSSNTLAPCKILYWLMNNFSPLQHHATNTSRNLFGQTLLGGQHISTYSLQRKHTSI